MTEGMIIERTVRFSSHARNGGSGGGRIGRPRKRDALQKQMRTMRVAKLMALAIRLDDLLTRGEVESLADLARAGRVTRARITQIMAMNHLAPDIQEAILDLPKVRHGRDPIVERHLRPIAAEMDWERQRAMWNSLRELRMPAAD